MMTCRELIEVLFEFESGELPEEHRERVAQHLCQCSSCVAFVESYRLTIQLPRRLPRPKMPEELEERLQAILAQCGAEKGPQ